VPKLNAIDAISPAFQLAKLNLFKPFRWSFWWRIAVLGLLTGELSSGGGGGNFNFPANFPPPQHRGGGDQLSFLARPLPHIDPHVLWVLIPTLVLAFVIFALVMMYLGSVCRFILLEAVLNGQISIRDAWGRWKNQGARFFGFQLVMGLIFLSLLAIIVVFFLMVVGVSTLKTGDPSGAKYGAIFGALMLFLLALGLLTIPYLIVFVLAKDFAVPVMALEGATFGDAWRKVWGMAKEETGSILGYFGMKIVLTIGAGVIFGIIGMMAIFIILVPVGGVGVVAVLGGKAAGLSWNLYTITLAVSIGLLIVFLLICVFALISVPVAMFFPAYGLYFFAGRYKPLHDRLFPPAPPATPVIAPPMPPDIPPEPMTS
jgi:hypothetical protein